MDSPLQRAMAALGQVYQAGKEKVLNAVDAAGQKGVAGNTLDALKGSAASYLTGTLGAPADYLSMIPLAPKESGNPYANAIRDFVQNPDKPFLGSDYLAEKIGLGGEGLAYGAGQTMGPAALKNLLKGTVKSDIFVRPNRPWTEYAKAKEGMGKTPQEIYEGGGFWGPSRMFKGADGQWYQEIPDYNAKFTPKMEEMLRENRNMFDPVESALRKKITFEEMDKRYPGRWKDPEDVYNYFWEAPGKWRDSSIKDENGRLNNLFDQYISARDTADKVRTQSSGALRDFLDHPELEKVAPELFDLPVTMRWELGEGGGSFNPSTGQIEAAAKPYGTVKGTRNTGQHPDLGTLLHEVNHGAQRLFDYGGGGSPSNVFLKDKTFLKPPSEEMVRDYAEQLKRPDVEPFRPIDRLAGDPKNPTSDEAYNAYRKIHGEQMSWMAGDRYKIPPNELKVPEYDTHPSNLIYSLPPSLQQLLESLKGVP